MAVFAVEYTYVNRPEALAEVRPDHRAFLRGLLDAGSLLASGPLSGGTAALLLILSDDADAARELLAPDPFAAAGLIEAVDVRAWSPVMGPWADLV